MKTPWTTSDRIALPASIAASLACVLPVLYRGWVPFDEGWILEQATRTMRGDLPHRDFVDLWTGGWSFIHAGLFVVFGPSMAVMRTVILLAWLAGLVLVYRIVRRWAEPVLCAAAVVVTALWTLWAWQMPLLNWFYAPLALFAVAALLPHEGRSPQRGHVIAGVAAGVMFTLKLTGLFLLAAILLWCVRAAARDARAAMAARASRPARDSTTGFTSAASVASPRFDGRWLAVTACALYAVLSVRLVSGMAGAESALVLIGGPSLLLSIGLSVGLWRDGRIDGLTFSSLLLRRVAWVLVGFAIPLAVLLAPYAATHSLGDWYRGVFVTPLRRLTGVSFPPPWWRLAVKFAGPAVLLWGGVSRARWFDSTRIVWSAVGLGVVLGAAQALLPEGPAYLQVLLSGIPLAIVGTWCWTQWRSRSSTNTTGALSKADALGEQATADRASDVALLVAAAATAQLIQVPYATLNYLLASTPLLVVAGLAVAAGANRRAPVLFALAALGTAGALGARRIPVMNEELKISGDARVPSGDALWIPRADSMRYAQVTVEITRHLNGGGLYVFPMHSEFYYFTGTRNPTRQLTALLATDDDLDPVALVSRLRTAHTSVVVLFPAGSQEWPITWQRAQQALMDEFPCERRGQRWAHVRWRRAPNALTCGD